MSDNPTVILGMILMLLVGVGMFMDINAALIILAPVLVPLTAAIGMNPIHAGIMIVLTLNISLMTPPVGACLFVLSSVTGEPHRADQRGPHFRSSLWRNWVLVLITFWPDLTLLVPRLLGL